MQLYQLQDILQTKVPEYAQRISELEKLLQQNNDTNALAVDQQMQLTRNAESERDVWKQQAETCKGNVKILTKKRGFGCVLKKIFTLGISGCR